MMSPPHRSIPESRAAADRSTRDQAPAATGELLSIRVREELAQTFVTPAGELDLSTAAAFNRCMWDAQTRGGQVVLDLRALVFIDSAGLRSLLVAGVRASETRRRLRVVCAHGQVRRMLSLSGLDELIETAEPPTPLQALQSRGIAA